jgi:hypothetical protein
VFLCVQELVLMAQLEHRNLVIGTEHWLEKSCVACLVLQYCAGGDLTAFLHSRVGALVQEADVHLMFVQVRAAVTPQIYSNCACDTADL